MQETWVQSLDGEDPLGKGMATHSSILAWKSPWRRSLAGYSPWGRKESDTTEQLTLYLMAQWLKIHLAIQGTWVQSLVGELRFPHPVEQLSPSAATIMPVGCKTHHKDPAHQKKKKRGGEITVSKLLKIKPNEDWPLIPKMTVLTLAITDSKRCFYHPVHLHVCESLRMYFLFSPTDLFTHLELCAHWNFHSWQDKPRACPHLFFKNIIAIL